MHQPVARRKKREQFYECLKSVIDKIPRRDVFIMMGDANSKVGKTDIVSPAGKPVRVASMCGNTNETICFKKL